MMYLILTIVVAFVVLLFSLRAPRKCYYCEREIRVSRLGDPERPVACSDCRTQRGEEFYTILRFYDHKT